MEAPVGRSGGAGEATGDHQYLLVGVPQEPPQGVGPGDPRLRETPEGHGDGTVGPVLEPIGHVQLDGVWAAPEEGAPNDREEDPEVCLRAGHEACRDREVGGAKEFALGGPWVERYGYSGFPCGDAGLLGAVLTEGIEGVNQPWGPLRHRVLNSSRTALKTGKRGRPLDPTP